MQSMHNRFKKIKKKIKDDVFDVDDQNREIVDITIKDMDDMLSVYSPDGKDNISPELANVIDNATKSTNYYKDIHLRFTCEKHPPEKEEQYKNAIKNYYINEFAEKERKLHNNLLIATSTFLLSIVFFVILFLVSSLNLPWIVVEFIDVIAWVFGWETVDVIVFRRQVIKYDQRKILKIIYANVSFLTTKKSSN